MDNKVPLTELQNRLERFRKRMDLKCQGWELIIIVSKINQYYFTGTMQDGMLFIPRDNEAVYYVRKSFERACNESNFINIKPMESYRDASSTFGKIPSVVYLETETVPLAMYQRLKKYFPFEDVRGVDQQIAYLRSIKSPYELSLIEKSGEIHRRVTEERIPNVLKENISEAELASIIYSLLIEEGHQGIVRFGMFDTEMVLGHICFGESSIYPSYFNGASGNYGMSPAVPIIGSRENRLKSGSLVYIDIGCGYGGYHTDKSTTYVFRGKLSDEVINKHKKCVEIQNQISSMLIPGTLPSDIYKKIINEQDDDFKKNFMGFKNHRVKFLGHGIGLTVDEQPVIAEGFNDPIEEGMVFAVEPKYGIEKVGMVGIENTFIVTNKGGRCVTGDNPGLIEVM